MDFGFSGVPEEHVAAGGISPAAADQCEQTKAAQNGSCAGFRNGLERDVIATSEGGSAA